MEDALRRASRSGYTEQVAAMLCAGGPDVIRKEAWSLYRTISGVRLCWELEESKGPKGSRNHCLCCSRLVAARAVAWFELFASSSGYARSHPLQRWRSSEREFFINNSLIRIHFISGGPASRHGTSSKAVSSLYDDLSL